MVKIGYRKPSLKKSIKARTTGKAKRAVKKVVVPGYGRKGAGWVKDPKRAAYNKVYHQTTKSILPKNSSTRKKKTQTIFKPQSDAIVYIHYVRETKDVRKKNWRLGIGFLLIIGGISSINIFFIALGAFFSYFGYKKRGDTKKIEIKIPVRNYRASEVEWIVSEGEQKVNIFNESINLFKETTNPEIFFSRYHLAIEKGKEIIALMAMHEFLSVEITHDSQTINGTVDRFISEKDIIVNDFIERYYYETVEKAQSLKTEKGKQNRLTHAYSHLLEFTEQLSENNIALIKKLWNNM